MADIKRTTEGLEHCLARYDDGLCDDCPYMGEIDRSYMIPMKCKEIIMRDALELLKDSVPQSVVDQIIWERDTALSQLKEIGKGLCERMDDVKPKKGKWKDIDCQTYTWKIRCNKCGYERSMMSTGATYPRYCEGCGSRMDGEHE